VIAAVILIPVLFSAAAMAVTGKILRRRLWLTASLLHLLAVVLIALAPPRPILGGWLAVDALGLLFLGIVSLLFLVSAAYGQAYFARLAAGEAHGSRDPERLFIACMLIFLATMSLVVLSHHLGLLWVAVEATTLASAPLIFFHRTVHSLEATWKYLLICSVGIALALFGTFFLGAAASAGGREGSLLLDSLLRMGPQLDVRLTRIAFIFLLVGYGTKMGLAPMHTWLPDAHSEAPSVVSSLLSGVLLNCAFLAILRAYQICHAAGEAAFAQNILLIFGLVSMLLAAVFILNQPDYKRLLAYSSVEHMGILALGIGLGPAGFYFALFHTLNHSLSKGGLFLTAGNILTLFKTKSIGDIRGLNRSHPAVGWAWIIGFLAISGTPLFGLFISEFNLLGVAVLHNRLAIAGLYLILLTAVFIGMAMAFFPMVQGKPGETPRDQLPLILRLLPLFLLLLTFLLGVHIPDWLDQLLWMGAAGLGGGR
jgi:hydrogenase-4 component F